MYKPFLSSQLLSIYQNYLQIKAVLELWDQQLYETFSNFYNLEKKTIQNENENVTSRLKFKPVYIAKKFADPCFIHVSFNAGHRKAININFFGFWFSQTNSRCSIQSTTDKMNIFFANLLGVQRVLIKIKSLPKILNTKTYCAPFSSVSFISSNIIMKR